MINISLADITISVRAPPFLDFICLTGDPDKFISAFKVPDFGRENSLLKTDEDFGDAFELATVADDVGLSGDGCIDDVAARPADPVDEVL